MKGIMFQEDLFKKVLSGEKTMTRRIIDVDLNNYEFNVALGDFRGIIAVFEGLTGKKKSIRSRYKLGEILYLKEPCGRISGIMFYKYDYPEGHKMRTEFKGWANKMFMKAESARYKIRITDVRLERVQDITNEDAWREGVSDSPEYNCIALFQNKWIKINGFSSWKPNPFVFVYSFERL